MSLLYNNNNKKIYNAHSEAQTVASWPDRVR